MTARHPGGEAAALRLVEMAGITPPCRLIDLGAGAGGSVRLLRSLGFEALGIDLLPGEGVERGDVLAPPFPPGSFDAALCECAFFLSGDPERALREAARLLRESGLNVTEISDRLGYCNPQYFSRTFAAVRGQSPSEYRRGLMRG